MHPFTFSDFFLERLLSLSSGSSSLSFLFDLSFPITFYHSVGGTLFTAKPTQWMVSANTSSSEAMEGVGSIVIKKGYFDYEGMEKGGFSDL